MVGFRRKALKEMSHLYQQSEFEKIVHNYNISSLYKARDIIDYELLKILAQAYSQIGNLFMSRQLIYRSKRMRGENVLYWDDDMLFDKLTKKECLDLVDELFVKEYTLEALVISIAVSKRYTDIVNFNEKYAFDDNLNDFHLCLLKGLIKGSIILVSRVNEADRKLGYLLNSTFKFLGYDSLIISDYFEEADQYILSSKYDGYLLIGMDNILREIYLRNHRRLHSYYRSKEIWSSSRSCFMICDFFTFLQKKYFNLNYDIFNCKEDVEFSIVIPVRNAPLETLESTLRSCIAQKGSFEVLVSENARQPSEKLLKFLKSINNTHIRYICSYQNLSLPQSFEYAFLNAKGKYLLSIGADDALSSDALKLIRLAFKEYDNDIVSWKFAQYFWPNHAHISRLVYEKWNKNIQIQEIVLNDIYLKTVCGITNFIHLPNLYLKTCFKREYIKEFINKTGSFENGTSQDVYTGLVSSLINERITFISFPVVIAGATSFGTGEIAEKMIDDLNLWNDRLKRRYLYNRFFNYGASDFVIMEETYTLGNMAVALGQHHRVKSVISTPAIPNDLIYNFIIRIYKRVSIFADKGIYILPIKEIIKELGYYNRFTREKMKLDFVRFCNFLHKIFCRNLAFNYISECLKRNKFVLWILRRNKVDPPYTVLNSLKFFFHEHGNILDAVEFLEGQCKNYAE